MRGSCRDDWYSIRMGYRASCGGADRDWLANEDRNDRDDARYANRHVYAYHAYHANCPPHG